MTGTFDSFVDVHVSGSRTNELMWMAGSTLKIPNDAIKLFSYDINRTLQIEPALLATEERKKRITEQEKTDFLISMRTVRMFTDEAPFSSRIPFSYQFISPFIRSMVARVIGGHKRRRMHAWARFPGFPLDLSVDALSDIIGVPYVRLKPTPVILTHDIDSLEGLKNLAKFVKEEEAAGARSTNFVVPCGWPLDHDILRGLVSSGHEIGIHGYNHSNTTAFLDESAIIERITKMEKIMSRYGVTGYRAPSLLRTRKLLKVLSRYFLYDSSIPTSGGLFPVPNNGCASARHFLVEKIHEIPLSMPRDGTLLFLGYRPDEIKDIWLTCADVISRSGGVIVLLTHCENRFSGNERMLKIYRDVLHYFKHDERFTFMTCAEFLTQSMTRRGDFS